MSEKETSNHPVLSTLVTGNHILHRHGVVDAYGHISVRNPSNPDTFFMSGSLAPALVSSLDDLVEYRVADASAVQENPPKGYIERFIHSEIFKRYPEVNSVVHAHSEAVIPFSLTNETSSNGAPELKPVFHMAGVIAPTGASVPVFDITEHYQYGDHQDFLVNNERLAAALATKMTPSNILGSVASTVKNYLASNSNNPVGFPACPVILIKQHGMTVCGHNIQEAVYRSIYTQNNARIQTTSLMLQANINQKAAMEAWKTEKPIPSPKDISYLSADQCKGAWDTLEPGSSRAWKLWCREVQVSPLYKNELGLPSGS